MRRRFLAILTSLLVVPRTVLTAEPRQHGGIPRIGILHPGSPPPAVNLVPDAVRDGLRELGYVEGRTIAIETRWARGNPNALPALAAELAGLKVDVLVAVSLPAVRAAREAAGTTPIVATDLQIDPVASGLAASVARPGGNITGLFLDFPELTGKWLQMIREVSPSARRVAVLWDRATGNDQVRAIEAAAQRFGFETQIVEMRGEPDDNRVLAAAMRQGPQALVQLSSPQAHQTSKRVADFTLKHRLPAISMFARFAEAGGLIAYGPDTPIFFRRSAAYVDRILKGAQPADLPIERPTTYELIVNAKTAKALRLSMPPSLLARADRVIL